MEITDQQPLVWIRISRILRIYDNVSGLSGRILDGAFISKQPSDALRIGEKKGEKYTFYE